MKCYRINELSAVAVPEVTEAPAELEAAINRAVSGWCVQYHMIWVCVADSDGGIDARQIKYPKTITLEPEQLVLYGDQVAGCFVENQLFLFDIPAAHSREVRRYEGYTGGWGDITEIDCYELTAL